jgi:hypothetical protein
MCDTAHSGNVEISNSHPLFLRVNLLPAIWQDSCAGIVLKSQLKEIERMSSYRLSSDTALQLTSSIMQNDDTIAEPLFKLVAGITNPRGDPLADSVRIEVLKAVYSRTEDFRTHFQNYIDEQTKTTEQINPTSDAIS